MPNLTIVDKNINQIKPYKNNPKLHSKHQIKQIVDSIKEFGFVNPVLLDENGEIIAGHGRYLAYEFIARSKLFTKPSGVSLSNNCALVNT